MKTIFLFFLAFAFVAGCKKSQPTETTAPENPGALAPATAGNSGAQANQSNPQATPAPPVDTTKAFADMNAALKIRDYQKATETLIVLQRKQLTDQQAIAVRGQMVQLQGAVAAGVASGDPNARAAADQLRASAMQP